MKIKLAEALLRRKELQNKTEQLKEINVKELYEVKTARKAAHEGLDDIIAQVPQISLSQVTNAFDWHARRLRKIDALIQQANWTTELNVDDDMMDDFEEK